MRHEQARTPVPAGGGGEAARRIAELAVSTMPRTYESPGALILRNWRRLQSVPAGSWIFSRLVGRMVPYTGALGSSVRELRPGYARVELRDRRGIRNHLNSVHAVALVNLGEFTGGLAVLTGLPPTVQGIVTGLKVEYTKKARGKLMAECNADIPAVHGEMDHVVRAEILDAGGDVVAKVAVTWHLRPYPSREQG